MSVKTDEDCFELELDLPPILYAKLERYAAEQELDVSAVASSIVAQELEKSAESREVLHGDEK